MTAPNPNRKKVLLIDDDAEFLELMKLNVERLCGGAWEVLAASTTSDALQMAESCNVDLAVIDWFMPVLDGLQFLQILHRKYPRLKKAILTSHADQDCRSTATSRGAELVLEKPLSPEQFDILVAALNELLQWRVEAGFRGVMRCVHLEDLLHMECSSRHSLVLEVLGQSIDGRIFIKDGSLIHAEAGDLEGKTALQELFALRDGEFHHQPFAEPPQRTLAEPWEFLIQEAVRSRHDSEDQLESNEEIAAAPAPPISQPAATLKLDAPSNDDLHPARPCIEMVVCSDQGELLFERQSSAAQQRCGLLMTLKQVSTKLQSLAPIGALERVEFNGSSGRVVAGLEDGHGIFVGAR